MSQDKATPRPWFIHKYYRSPEYKKLKLSDFWSISGSSGRSADEGKSLAQVFKKENVELIVRAVNCHDGLIRMLEEASLYVKHDSLGAELSGCRWNDGTDKMDCRCGLEQFKARIKNMLAKAKGEK